VTICRAPLPEIYWPLNGNHVAHDHDPQIIGDHWLKQRQELAVSECSQFPALRLSLTKRRSPNPSRHIAPGRSSAGSQDSLRLISLRRARPSRPSTVSIMQRSGASLAITVAKSQIALFGHRACAQNCIFPKRARRLNGSTEQSSLQCSKCYADSNILGRCGSEPCRHARITAGRPGDRPNIHLTPNLRGIGWFSQSVLAGPR
jgi:hypothetical protein